MPPGGIEPPSPVPKTGTLSAKLRRQKEFLGVRKIHPGKIIFKKKYSRLRQAAFLVEFIFFIPKLLKKSKFYDKVKLSTP